MNKKIISLPASNKVFLISIGEVIRMIFVVHVSNDLISKEFWTLELCLFLKFSLELFSMLQSPMRTWPFLFTSKLFYLAPKPLRNIWFSPHKEFCSQPQPSVFFVHFLLL